MLKGKYALIISCWVFRFGRKLSVIRGIVEQEIQAMVSKRDNIATHHLYQAWDPVPSLSPVSTGRCLWREGGSEFLSDLKSRNDTVRSLKPSLQENKPF